MQFESTIIFYNRNVLIKNLYSHVAFWDKAVWPNYYHFSQKDQIGSAGQPWLRGGDHSWSDDLSAIFLLTGQKGIPF